MLEYEKLLIQNGPEDFTLTIQNALDSQLLGHAFFKSTLLGQSWSVHEAEDSPLIFSAKKLNVPFARWQVSDACELLIGVLHSDKLLMPTGGLFCYRNNSPSGISIWEDEVGKELARHQFERKKGSLLVFLPASGNPPFGKMLILADFLIHFVTGNKVQATE